MDAIVKPWPKGNNPTSPNALSDHVRHPPQPVTPRPSRDEAEAAVRSTDLRPGRVAADQPR